MAAPRPAPSLAPRVALVTGGAKGIGLEIARALGQRGAKILIGDVAGAASAAIALRAESIAAEGVEADTSSEADVARMVDAAARSFGRLDIVVNNAGLFTSLPAQPFHAIAPDAWKRVLDVNVTGAFLVSRAAYPLLKQSGAGRIINITSATAFSTPGRLLHYVTSKGALTAMTRALAREVGVDGITVNAIAPGFTLSAGVLEHKQETLAASSERSRQARAIPRDQEPQDIVGAAAFLAGDEAAFITGQTLVVDGGAVMH